MEGGARQDACANFFVKNFGTNVLPGTAFHMVMFTATDDMLAYCFTCTAVSVPVFINASTWYHARCIADGDDTKDFVVHCKPNPIEVFSSKKFAGNVLPKNSARLFWLGRPSIW